MKLDVKELDGATNEFVFDLHGLAVIRFKVFRLATVRVISAVTSSLTQQICLCDNELMRKEIVVVI